MQPGEGGHSSVMGQHGFVPGTAPPKLLHQKMLRTPAACTKAIQEITFNNVKATTFRKALD